MSRVAGLDVGGSSVKAWVRSVDGPVISAVTRPLETVRPGPHRAELVPADWEATCRGALAEAVHRAGPGEWLGVTVSTLRQGFVLLDRSGRPLGNGILNSDRRGGPYAGVLAGLHPLTGHWPAPELTLPKLIAVQREEPDRWAGTARVLFLHDWLLWLMCGVQATEASYACAGAMADVAARGWARDLLQDNGIGAEWLAPVVEAGTVLGELSEGWALPATLPVVSGCGDTQLAAAGAGGLAAGVVTVVAGSSTPVQAAVAAPVDDPLGRPWVSTHADRTLWAVEGNAGYPGTFSGWWSALAPAEPARDSGGVVAVTAAPYWSQQTWERKPPASLVGLTPATTAGEVARALAESHAFAVRGGIEDLERALAQPFSTVVVTGGAAIDGTLPALLAEVLGRDVHWARESSASAAGTALVARAVGGHAHLPGLPPEVVAAGDPAPLDPAYRRWWAATDALRTSFGEGQ